MTEPPFVTKIASAIEKHRLLAPDRENRLIIGLSGGMDSMCLLDVLLRLNSAGAYKISLLAVHINHCLRGAEADADEAFVREYCERAGVPALTFRAGVREAAARNKLSVEEAGRAERMRIFREVMAETGAEAAALAHHMDDSVETVLMNIGRGSGPDGLAGIRPVSGGETRIIRPFIETRRAEIARYAAENGIPFRNDKSNGSPEYTRNRVRNGLIPELSRVFGRDATANIARLSAIIAEENECMDAFAGRLYEQCVFVRNQAGDAGGGVLREVFIPALAGQPTALIKRLFRLIIKETAGRGKDVSYALIGEITHLLTARTGKKVFLPGGIRVLRSYDRLIFTDTGKKAKKNGDKAESILRPSYLLSMGGSVYEPNLGLWFTMSGEKKVRLQNCVNVCTKIYLCDKIPGIVEVRTRRPGDRIRLRNAGTQKLSDYFINNKTPQSLRDAIPLVAAGRDILWILDERNATGEGACFTGENSPGRSGQASEVYIQTWREIQT